MRQLFASLFRSGGDIVLVGLLAWVLAYTAVNFNSTQAPDVFTDEILYTRAGIRIASEGALAWDTGRPLVVHPPIFFLSQALWQDLQAEPETALYRTENIFEWVYRGRVVNAIFAGLTAAVLYWIGRRVHGVLLGALLVLLFIFDPFGVRSNRRVMIETLAMLLTLTGMGVVLTAREGLSWRRAILAGMLLGAALLTKELSFTALVVLAVYWLWQKRAGEIPKGRAGFKHPLWLTIAIGYGTYLIFPIWAWTTGRWEYFVHEKTLSLRRLLGMVHLTGWNRPGVSLLDFLIPRLLDYATSYILLGLGGMATLWLLLLHSHDRTSRLIISWGLVLYPFYAGVALVGSGNDQFFYFLLVPAMLIVGYALVTLPVTLTRLKALLSQRFGSERALLRRPLLARNHALILGSFIALVMVYNVLNWWITYGSTRDDSYHQLADFVEQHVPPGEEINASGDKVKYKYFFPNREIGFAATPAEAVEQDIHYFVLSPKDVKARYGVVTEDLQTWLQTNGERIFATYGDSYGDLYLYRVESQTGAPAVPSEELPRTFAPSVTGFVGPLLTMLAAWLLTGLSAIAALSLRGRKSRTERYAEAAPDSI